MQKSMTNRESKDKKMIDLFSSRSYYDKPCQENTLEIICKHVCAPELYKNLAEYIISDPLKRETSIRNTLYRSYWTILMPNNFFIFYKVEGTCILYTKYLIVKNNNFSSGPKAVFFLVFCYWVPMIMSKFLFSENTRRTRTPTS